MSIYMYFIQIASNIVRKENLINASLDLRLVQFSRCGMKILLKEIKAQDSLQQNMSIF